MPFYLTESQVPELACLPAPFRRTLVTHALAMMRGSARFFCWLPTLLCAAGGLGGSLLGIELLRCAVRLGYVHNPPALNGDSLTASAIWSYTGVVVGGVLAGFTGLHVQRAKLRPYLRRAIEEYVSRTAYVAR
jgi:hypothetical protein